jgi:hypothetical protein
MSKCNIYDLAQVIIGADILLQKYSKLSLEEKVKLIKQLQKLKKLKELEERGV